MSRLHPSATPRRLLVVGAGGLGREVVEAIRSDNERETRWELLGFLDDDPTLVGTSRTGAPVLAGVDGVDRFPNAQVVVTTGRPDAYASRMHIVRRLGLTGERYATVIHPQAAIAPSTRIGHGCVLLAGTVTTADVRIGRHVVVMPGTILTHDVAVDEFATLASGVRLSGAVHVGEGAYVGSGALVREGCRIGAWSLVGMGAVVLRDVPAGEVWAGVPAQRLRCADVPLELLAGARA